MARLACSVFAGVPHNITQRGNGRAQTFFVNDDYRLYRDLLAEQAAAAGVEVWAWVLMPNHVHLVLAPSDPDGIRRALAPVHRRYAGRVHARLKRTGHFWQGRFGCVTMDEELRNYGDSALKSGGFRGHCSQLRGRTRFPTRLRLAMLARRSSRTSPAWLFHPVDRHLRSAPKPRLKTKPFLAQST